MKLEKEVLSLSCVWCVPFPFLSSPCSHFSLLPQQQNNTKKPTAKVLSSIKVVVIV
jgi:hypothetical protein